MIRGEVTGELQALVRVTVCPAAGNDREVECVVDSGYNGSLTLPPDLIAELGLIQIGSGEAILADGSEELLRVFGATVLWNGQRRAIEVDEANADSLLGMALMEGHDLHIRAVDGGEVTIQPVP